EGHIFADNTDGYGFAANLKHGAPGWSAKDKQALVLGAGGASRGVLWALLDQGMSRVFLANRTREKAEALYRDFGERVEVVDWGDAPSAVENADLLVNTTSLGMTGRADLGISLEHLSPTTLVTDIVYTPLETTLLREARKKGCSVVDGLGMLLHQAVPGFEAWFGVRPEVTNATRAAIPK
ncbi:MAG: shikimate dehydrogenase, partial [Pseudomonadota bacterium]